MLEFINFYDIAEYANEHWGGKFTPREIACNAFDWFTEYQMSIVAKEPTHNIQVLLNELYEDAWHGSEEANKWATEIKNSIVTAARV